MARPLRSWMFVPGDKPRFHTKAAPSTADAIFLDLEDGVLPDQKTAARELVESTLDEPVFGPLRYVRINAAASPWYEDDVEAVLRPGLDGICLPKAETADDVAALSQRIAAYERNHDLATGAIQVVAAVETARALIRAPEIAAADQRVAGLMFGAEDFGLDLGLGTAREGAAAELLYARSALVVAAAAAAVLSIDGVYPDLDDTDGFARDLRLARQLGFSAKSTFNPRQLDEINESFSLRPDEVDYARTVVAAFDDARARGDASVAVGGQLVDLPIVRRAQRILELDGSDADRVETIG